MICVTESLIYLYFQIMFYRMRTSLILKRSWATTGMIHRSGRESASKYSFAYSLCSPTLPVFINFIELKKSLLVASSATLKLNTISKHCVKVLHLNLKSLEFRECPSCKYLNKRYSAYVNCLFPA